ncbi:MAG: PAS domain S-box protein [Desulfobulbus sp.]|nr:PAS domain S-box protein [Desulfobulbus sp.]
MIKNRGFLLDQLIPPAKLRLAVERFCASIGIGCIIVDPKGGTILQVNWKCLCRSFSNKNPPVLKSCVEIDNFFKKVLHNSPHATLYTCDNGLSSAVVPILVDGVNVANIFIGQFIVDSYDINIQKKIAKSKGIAEIEYVGAVTQLPVMSDREIQITIHHLELFAELLGEICRNYLQKKRLNEKIEKNKERYYGLVNSLPQIIYEIDLYGHLSFINNSAYESFGYTSEELIKSGDFLSLITENKNDLYSARKRLEGILSGEKLPPKEYYFRRKNGDRFIALVFSSPVFSKGELQGVGGIIVDITEQKKTEENLRRNEAKLQSLFRAVPVGLTILKDRTLHSVNEGLCKIVGYDDSDLLFRTSLQLYESEEEYIKVGAALYQQLSDEQTGYVETRFCRRDGSIREVSLFAAPLDPSNPAEGAAVAIQDITEQKRAEKALRISEERLSFAISASSDAIWEMKPKSQTVYYSPRWYEMLGYPDQAFPVTLEKWKSMCHPADCQSTQRLMEHVLASPSDPGYTSEFRLRHRDGRWIWVLSRGKVVKRDAMGTPVLLAGTNTNITKRKLAEEALKVSEERYRTLFETSSNAILIVKNDIVVDCNQQTLDMLRCSREKIIGKSSSRLFVCQQTDGKSDAIRNNPPEIIQEIPFQYEWLQCRLDGTNFHAEVNVSEVDLVGEKYSQVIIRDITLRKTWEKSLRESEFRFRSFFNTNPEGIILLDFQGFILDANKAFLQGSGFSFSEVTHRHFTEFVPHAHHSASQQALLALKSGISQNDPLEISYLTKNGQEKPVAVKGWVVQDEKNTSLYLGIFIRDLTKEKELTVEKISLEKQVMQAQKNEAIGTLAGGIAHDFNNILGGIVGFAQLALYSDPSTMGNKERQYINRVLEASERAKALVQQILRFSRHSSIEMHSINLIPVIEEAIHLLRSTLPKSIEIRQQLDVEDDRIIGDSTQIHQVVTNLGTNAYHAMRETGGILSVSLRKVTLVEPKETMSMKIPPGEYLKLQVKDTGSGMPPSVLQRIFEPYFTTKKVNEGTGLGMAVTLGIIKGHKGMIEIETASGQGTSFDIFLPLTQIDTGKRINEEINLPLGQGERVLIVDDEAFFLEVVKESLNLLGYKVTASQSSLKTLEIFKAAPSSYDLLITDQSMPEMTGAQLSQEVRRMNPSIPIILCTGYSETVTEQSANYYGITSFLMKPVNVHDLAKTVHDVLGKGTAK